VADGLDQDDKFAGGCQRDGSAEWNEDAMSGEMFFEDYVTGAARETTGRTITEADVVLHAGQTGDFYPHHMDAEWCKTQPFGQRMAHGTLVFSVGVGMTAGAINPWAMSYGYDRLRFVKPVFLNDTIRVVVTIKEKRDDAKRPGHGIVVEGLQVVNQRGETVLVAEHLLLVERRGEGKV
jgi:acyl dehydratase